ncbi:nuclear transport factor 2 family protein [Mangrovicoccus algicola]|uniref:Nuclear transport factor 2 family protein n=1 Tax=Mangrovicoccus algicola TaxID=2771008 RepID=A0A8J6Z7E8_9RHOB|nr:nuclear transport factor 2 family protein [Mangrovicoccus algicola]MBE3639354.1 nuclear transport factor 2 family protein [Mangrovicoccus algicola]
METGAAAEAVTIEMVRTFLDRMSAAVTEADFDSFAEMFELPFSVHTRLHHYQRRDRTELRVTFDVWRRTIEVNMATAVVLRPRRIEAFGSDVLMVEYDSDLLRGAQKMLPTFASLALLRRRAARWRMEQVMTGTQNAEDSLFLRVDPVNPVPQTETYILGKRPGKD